MALGAKARGMVVLHPKMRVDVSTVPTSIRTLGMTLILVGGQWGVDE
jgi:hypothetical protein